MQGRGSGGGDWISAVGTGWLGCCLRSRSLRLQKHERVGFVRKISAEFSQGCLRGGAFGCRMPEFGASITIMLPSRPTIQHTADVVKHSARHQRKQEADKQDLWSTLENDILVSTIKMTRKRQCYLHRDTSKRARNCSCACIRPRCTIGGRWRLCTAMALLPTHHERTAAQKYFAVVRNTLI